MNDLARARLLRQSFVVTVTVGVLATGCSTNPPGWGPSVADVPATTDGAVEADLVVTDACDAGSPLDHCAFGSGRTCAVGASCTADDGCNGCRCNAAGDARGMPCAPTLSCTLIGCYPRYDAGSPICPAPGDSSCRHAIHADYVCQNSFAHPPRDSGLSSMYYCPGPSPSSCPAAGCVLDHVDGDTHGGFWCCP